MSATKPGRHVFKSRQAPFSIGTFISNVCNNRYVLVIGDEVILDKDEFADVNGNLQSFVLRELNLWLGRDFPSLSELVASRPLHSTNEDPSGTDLIREFYLAEGHDAYIAQDDLSPELVDLLQTRLFRFVMTTSVAPQIERLMRDIWKEELRVVNIADQADWKRFQQEIADTIDRGIYSETVYRYNRPTLVYIFGKVTSDTAQDFLKTENDAIRFIELWMNRQEPIIKLMKDRRVLALGCKFKDWYFRFFWYILKRDFNRLGEGEVALSLDDGDPDEKNLHRFLDRKQIRLHTDARGFMRSVCDMLNPEKHSPDSEAFHELLKSKRGDGEVFLSYCHQDFILASRIFFQLTEQGYSVWFDNEKLCGGGYEAEIRSAIDRARVVITLLTPNIVDDLAAGVPDRFYVKEWRWASQTGCSHIIPLAADGYDLGASYHKTYEQVIRGEMDGVDLMKEDFSQLKKVIDHLKTR